MARSPREFWQAFKLAQRPVYYAEAPERPAPPVKRYPLRDAAPAKAAAAKRAPAKTAATRTAATPTATRR